MCPGESLILGNSYHSAPVLTPIDCAGVIRFAEVASVRLMPRGLLPKWAKTVLFSTLSMVTPACFKLSVSHFQASSLSRGVKFSAAINPGPSGKVQSSARQSHRAAIFLDGLFG